MPQETEQTTENPTLLFVKEVGKYFMDFLETDFHKRRLPRRSIKLHNDKGLLTGININKYPSFHKVVHRLVAKGFDHNVIDRVEKGVYKADIPTSLLNHIKTQIKKTDVKTTTSIIKELDEALSQTVAKHGKDYVHAIDVVLEESNKIFKKHIVLDLVKSIEQSLISSKLGDDNTLYQMEEELASILTKKVQDKLTEILKLLINKEKVNVVKQLKDVLHHDSIQDSLVKFFEMFKVADLFSELHELYRNYKTEDKQEFYLYLYDISFEKNKYPIFYVPFSIERKNDELFIAFDSQLYINKKALSYIAQQYNIATNKKGMLTGIEERIVYLADHTDDLGLLLQELMTAIINFFGLDTNIDATSANIQTSKSLLVDVSTNVYVALFDKSDEALINDYEEILNASEDSPLMSIFQSLIDDFIHKNPEDVSTEVRDEWDDKDTSDRLVYQSPIPLNSEQLNIISALRRQDCKYVLVEGPPGTGKSHTITAIAFNAILEDKSVLILSDKKEALDVVEKNIVNTMNKVRLDKKFQNPILRLGKTGSTYSQILTQSSIDGITEQFRAVRQNYHSIKEGIENSLGELKQDLTTQIETYNKISPADIQQYAELNQHFQENSSCVDLEEVLDEPTAAVELGELRAVCLRLAQTIGLTNVKFDINQDIEETDHANLKELAETVESLKDFVAHNGILFEPKSLKEYYELAIKYRPDHEVLQSYLQIYKVLFQLLESNKSFIKFVNVANIDTDRIDGLTGFVNSILALEEALQKVEHFAGSTISTLSLLGKISEADVLKLQAYIQQTEGLKSGLLGYLGKKDKLEALNKEFRKDFPFSTIMELHKNLPGIKQAADIYGYIYDLRDAFPSHLIKEAGFVSLIGNILKDKNIFYSTEVTAELRKLLDSAESVSLESQPWYQEAGITHFYQLHAIAGMDEYFDLWDKFLILYKEEEEVLGNPLKIHGEDVYPTLMKADLNKLFDQLDQYKNFVKYLLEFKDDIGLVNAYLSKYSQSVVLAGIDSHTFSTICANKLTEISDLEFEKLTQYITLHQQLTKYFNEIEPLQYGDRMRGIEGIVTTEMTYLMDERFINFAQKYKNDAKALKAVIKSKKKFPRDKFAKLKEAFPCILAGIRDYAEYIPLEPDLFDLVIIDEASQVSIAQSFPALLRAKKVVVLGDNQQFSNVKSALARGDINQNYLNSLQEVFEQNISTATDQLERLAKFNIKVSILDFFEFVNNYKTRLVKHFRGYKEIISYSDKHFYNGSLQVMKIRGKPIQDVLKFTVVPHDGLAELKPNTNTVEVDFIIEELSKLKEQGSASSVGIITPHTNQQLLLYEKISQLLGSDYFFDTLDLKIMTFDTCQGEERDIIYYSMVATETDDKLAYIFIRDLSNIQEDEEEGKIKAQRLNVGFSRAKECMHFVLSKPVEKFSGSIGQALKHYNEALADGAKEASVDQTDKNSGMEPLVLTWLYQTKFWEENKDRAEIKPQFELGKYLKQLDKTYNHPHYRVDFLLIYNDESGKENKVIIEYDGFLEHFGHFKEGTNAMNYTSYYSEGDVYRQQVLESYGYKFIRLNKFNLGNDPIATIDGQLHETFKKKILIMKS